MRVIRLVVSGALLLPLPLLSAPESPSPSTSPVKKRKIIPMIEGHKLRSANEALPKYPEEAKNQRWTGKGVIALYVRADGTVYDAKVIQSTGHSLLDAEAVRAFRTWVFRPEKASFVAKVPCDFELPSSSAPSPSTTR